jgi:hypothetical protein
MAPIYVGAGVALLGWLLAIVGLLRFSSISRVTWWEGVGDMLSRTPEEETTRRIQYREDWRHPRNTFNRRLVYVGGFIFFATLVALFILQRSLSAGA